MDDIIKKAGVLIEALPYIKNFYDKTIVIKYGGAAMTDDALRRSVLEDIVFMNYVGMQPILVHGGGPKLTQRLKDLGITTKFVEGYRVTDEETMRIAEEEFMKINADIVRELKSLGASAMSLSGKEDGFIEVQKHAPIEGVDLGYVGEIKNIDTDVISKMLTTDIIPVIPPVGVGESDGHAYNINADQVASEVAAALSALKLVVLTNVQGILRNIDNTDSLITHVTLSQVKQLIDSGVVSGGMLPKVNACVHALEHGVTKSHILDAKIPHALLLEIFTDKGVGTEFVKS